MIVFSTESYAYMADAICALGSFERGQVERKTFPDGERYQRVLGTCAGADIAVVGGTISDSDTLELFDLACAMVKYGARRLTLVIPYFGYSTMERAIHDGEVVTAKCRARLISAIPPAAMGNRVLTVDLHAAGIMHYFEGGISPVHVYAKPLVEAAAQRLGGDDFVLGCTDAGRAKWVESLALGLNVTPAFVYKRRVDGSRTEVTGVSAHVKGKPVVIYDDMIRTGGSLLGAARAYEQAGATSIAAITTHGLFPGDALDRLQASGLFSEIVATDSHPRAVELGGEFLRVESIASLLAEEVES